MRTFEGAVQFYNVWVLQGSHRVDLLNEVLLELRVLDHLLL